MAGEIERLNASVDKVHGVINGAFDLIKRQTAAIHAAAETGDLSAVTAACDRLDAIVSEFDAFVTATAAQV